jgi:AraC-like DNA-binding protein
LHAARRSRLQGIDVDDWMRAHGWRMTGSSAEGARMFADEAVSSAMTIRRVWHTPFQFEALPARTPRRTLVWLQVDGSLTLRGESSRERTIGPPSVFFPTPGVPLTVRSTAPTARIEIEIDDIRRGSDGRPGEHSRTHDVAPPIWLSVVGMVNAILNADAALAPRVSTLASMAIEALVDALRVEWSTSSEPLSSPGDVLVEKALSLIHVGAADPELTVRGVADSLGVSRSYLTRLFRQRGLSPRSTLQRERLVLAQRVRARHPSISLAALARAAGYPSARALREALSDERSVRDGGETFDDL